MKAEERDPVYLETTLLLIERIRTRLAKVNMQTFVEDPDEIDLLSYRLSMIGEYAGKLSEALRGRHPDIPWRLMSGLRNIVAHEYMRVTPSRIWQTAINDLDDLEALCRAEIQNSKQ